jgi:hypothetical protein
VQEKEGGRPDRFRLAVLKDFLRVYEISKLAVRRPPQEQFGWGDA